MEIVKSLTFPVFDRLKRNLPSYLVKHCAARCQALDLLTHHNQMHQVQVRLFKVDLLQVDL